jgi:anaerobic selenocysteine-containing dehydrogenase
MKRAGERGENRWIRITWDEALDTIAEKMKHYRDTYGPESIAMVLGEPKSMDYPLYLTNGKEGAYFSSGYRHIEGMKKYSAEAICELNPRTASRYGLKEGEMIWIKSRKGRIQQRLKISDHVHPNVILAAFGWWDTVAENSEYDWRKYNINILTEGDGADCPATGSVQLRGVPVRVYSEEQSWGNPPGLTGSVKAAAGETQARDPAAAHSSSID